MARKSKDVVETNISPDDEVGCLTEYTELMSESARVRQKIATMFSRFSNMGVDTKGIKAAYKRAQSNDPTGDHKRQMALEARLGIIDIDWGEDGQGDFGRSLNMPSESARLKLTLSQANADGYNSGYAGGLCEAPPGCEPGTEHHVKWLEGWYLGHADREAAGKGDVEKASPRSRKAREPADA